MEKQNIAPSLAQPPTPTPIPIRQLYNLNQRNYSWQSFKYQLPKKYTHEYTSNIKSGALFCKKSNYLDQLRNQKKGVPGPNYYEVGEDGVRGRPKSGKMDRGRRVTVSEEAKERAEKERVPGPGAYFKRPQSATTGSVNRDKVQFEKTHYLTEVEYLADLYPGVGAYNLSSPKHIAGPKLFKQAHRKITKKDNKQNEMNQKFLNTVGSIQGTFEWMKSQAVRKDSNYFTRTQRFGKEGKQGKQGRSMRKMRKVKAGHI